MTENIELREVPGRPGFYYVIRLIDGRAMGASEVLERIEPEGTDSEADNAVIFTGTMHPLPDAHKREEAALELWQEYINSDLSPVEYRGYCVFCGADIDSGGDHAPDCIYIRAKELIRE